MLKKIYYTDYRRFFFILILSKLLLLLMLPYLNIKLTSILLLQVILLFKFKYIYIVVSSYFIKRILYIIFFTLVINTFLDYSTLTKITKLIPTCCIPYSGKLIRLYINDKQKFQLSYCYICFYLPKYMKQIFETNIKYIVIITNLYLFIKKEILFKYLIKYLSIISQTKLINVNRLNSLFSNQILEKLLDSIESIYIGIKVKNKSSKFSLVKNTTNITNICMEILLDVTYSYNITLWTKAVTLRYKNRKFLV
uniref:Uncharacterized protein n=1 Tax=Polysiphonia scopulorum TaxID=257860 RepID=A0A1Z1MHM4_9FLOR|nr:hypothetical protein [Polysiphonia scopulorum]ARW65577.1 hypothetical protein [Polysiphonia scopulorum]